MKSLPNTLPLLGISALIAAAAFNASGNGHLKEQAPPLNVTLPHQVSGQAAIAALGRNLPAVAAAHGMTADRLQDLLNQEPQLKVDRSGRLFYEEPAMSGFEPATPGDAQANLPESAPPPDQAFLLHSRPGARKIIYLDFDGHLLSGTAWNASYNAGNDIVCPPWDIDGNPSVFGDTERARIVQMWQRVAEDYAPFDVDVTTEYPGEAALTRSSSSDDAYGMRVLVSPISGYVGNYGGIAYIGAFNDVGDYYKPALVFPEKLANGEKYIGEACSHEAGHNVGLNHDGKTDGTSYYQGHGSGETAWSPIMGVGYYKNLSQWSKGEYSGANNTQDDLSIIQTYIAFRPDDHGNTSSTATMLPAGLALNATGLIASSGDIDVFGFVTGAGLISLSVLPCELGPNLDILMQLHDSAGNLLGTSNPADLLGASLNLSVSAGTYYLSIRGTGVGDPLLAGYTSYGSIGQYQVSGSVVDPSGTVPPVARATATTTSGTAPLSVQFNSSQSYDPDGTIAGYFWSFGDGGISQEPNPTHVYAAAGDYSATLTVSDSQGLSGTDTLLIRVQAPNLPPTASITATPSSGYAPLSVSFSGAGSTDSDGSIVSYQWTFGDGTTGSGANVSHVYSNVGSYTARLTVTDDRGATNSTTAVVQVSQNPAKVMRVQGIALSVVVVKRTTTVDARVTITDVSGAPISGVTVSGQWGGVATGTSTANTDGNGVALLKSKSLRKSGTVSFSVTGATKATFTYDPSKNMVTSAAIAASSKL